MGPETSCLLLMLGGSARGARGTIEIYDAAGSMAETGNDSLEAN